MLVKSMANIAEQAISFNIQNVQKAINVSFKTNNRRLEPQVFTFRNVISHMQ